MKFTQGLLENRRKNLKRGPNLFSLTDLLTHLWINEKGQATTEYMLILAMIVSMLVMMIKKLLQPMFQKLMGMVSNTIEKKFFGSDLHTYRVRR